MDESGKPTLSDQDSDPWYVLTAIIVSDVEFSSFTERLDEVSWTHFHGNEIKSSRIGSDHRRRLTIVRDLLDTNWTYSMLVVRKSDVFADSGLRFKPVMHKFMTRLLVEQLRPVAASVRITQDLYGSDTFMASVQDYLSRRVQSDLFFDVEHNFSTSATTRGIQAADLVAGTLRHWVAAQDDPDLAKCRDVLRAREVSAVSWPIADVDYVLPTLEPPLSRQLREHLLETTLRLSSSLESSEEVVDQQMLATLETLAFARVFESERERSLTATDLMAMLVLRRIPAPSDQLFRATVIGGLRDRGIVIAGGNSGYRLALDSGDIAAYLEHTGGVVLPMLARLEAARRTLMAAGPVLAAQITEGNRDLAAVLDAFIEHQFRDAPESAEI